MDPFESFKLLDYTNYEMKSQLSFFFYKTDKNRTTKLKLFIFKNEKNVQTEHYCVMSKIII